LAGAEKKYREKDRACAESVKNIPIIAKNIDRALYPIRELLLKFGRTKGTLLEADFRQIMDFFSAENMTLPKIQYLVKRTIDALEPIKIKLKRQQTNDTTVPKNWHNEDFTRVLWYGTEYQFNKTQARCIKYLWDNKSATETSIGEMLDSAADVYRLKDTFRNKNGYHCVWGKMIQSAGKGCFKLNKPKS
jgi:hypothetical protein